MSVTAYKAVVRLTSLHLLSGTYILEVAEHFCPQNSNAPLTEQNTALSEGVWEGGSEGGREGVKKGLSEGGRE